MAKTNIIIAGIGGVGGFFGGKLAAHYATSADVDVCFMARGENEKVIREKGLLLETTEGSYTAHPKKVSHNPAEFGIADFVVCCTKAYNLEESIQQLLPCIDQNTVILPLLNGVDSYEKIKALLPNNEVWDGCVYIVTRLPEPGVVKETGNISFLDFGARKGSPEKLELFEKLLKEAGIKARFSANIRDTIWKKYSFIATVASLTFFLDSSIGSILENPESKKLLLSLLEELKAVADAHGINLPENIVQKNIDIMASLPYETTSSMHTDFLNGKPTEVDSITGYVVRLGKELEVPTPTFHMIYDSLLLKSREAQGS